MPLVYVFSNKNKRQTKVGFTDDVDKELIKLNASNKGWILLNKEHYTSKKNALIRVKQLKNKLK